MPEPLTHMEYAISAGEGTLIEYGVWDLVNGPNPTNPQDLPEDFTVILSPCAADCSTGS